MVRTTVVGLRLSEITFSYWQTYAEFVGMDFTQMLIMTVEEFLEPKLEEPIFDQKKVDNVVDLVNKLNIQNSKLKTLNFRIPIKTLERWDLYCNQSFITRTSLIKKAMWFYFKPQRSTLFPQLQSYDEFSKPKLKIPSIEIGQKNKLVTASEIEFILPILGNFINHIGLMEFYHLDEIFLNIDGGILNRMLNLLEKQGKIARKGFNTYVPANPMESAMGTLFAAQNLGKITDQIKNNPEDFYYDEHISLLRNIFEYFEVFLNSLQQDLGQIENIPTEKYTSNLKSIDSAKKMHAKLLQELNKIIRITI